jgi:hypothetical protein
MYSLTGASMAANQKGVTDFFSDADLKRSCVTSAVTHVLEYNTSITPPSFLTLLLYDKRMFLGQLVVGMGTHVYTT